MSEYEVLQIDPAQHKEGILKFWEDYLPGTPVGRFEWLNRGNPAGEAIWFFAFNRKNNDIAGVISIMPKEITLKGRTMRGGILGDFMVQSKYRVFGPNLLLPKTVLSRLSNKGLNFFYTVPNLKSEEIMKRVGFNKAGVMYSLVKVIRTRHYLNKYLNFFAGHCISPFADVCLRTISRETYVSGAGVFEETAVIDDPFDFLWQRVKFQQPQMMGDHSPSYIRWRYLQNPLHKFRVLTYKKESNGDLLGFIVFTIERERLYIFDIIALERTYINRLLKKVISIGMKEYCVSICIDVFETNPLLPLLKSFGFLNARSDIPIYSFGGENVLFQDCRFFGGDRNI